MKRTFTLLATCIFGVLAASQAFATTPNIVFISDFGLADDSVSQCKAVILDVAPETHVIDMTHGVVPYDIRFAAFLLADSAGYWPPGTVFLAVVDPGVGTDRKRVAIKTKSGRYFVGPDNGIFSIVARLHGIEKAVYIENMKYARTSVSSTFEGRDVFAPVAAWLIRDPAVFDRLGPVVKKIKSIDYTPPSIDNDSINGTILQIEKAYGNVWTDISRELFKKTGISLGSRIRVRIDNAELELPLVRTFGDVKKGDILAYFNSRGLLSFAANQGDFSKIMPLYEGKKVQVEIGQNDLVDIESMSTGNLKLDIRYATKNNFTGTQIYQSPRCILRRDAAQALVKASELARISPHPFTICVLDCYRPLSVQKLFWNIMPDERYVANPAKGSRHNRGMAVDVTACTPNGVELEMPTAFDNFTGKAARDAVPKTGEAGDHYRGLDEVMKKSGFVPFPSEWWHYDFPGWESAPVLDVPVELD